MEKKSFCILGLGKSGHKTLEYLLNQQHTKIIVSDTRYLSELAPSTRELLTNHPELSISLGQKHSALCLEADHLIVSPGIKPNTPILQQAHKLSKKIYTEIDLALGELCEKILLAVTGSNGKSTITACVAHLLGITPYGNIGEPLISKLLGKDKHKEIICEISSFQLAHSSDALKPNIAAISNISPDHLDWHGSMQNYVNSKRQITSRQDKDDWLILPHSQAKLAEYTQAQIFWIDSDRDNSLRLDKDNQVIVNLRGKEIVGGKLKLSIPGTHNQVNALFAVAMVLLHKGIDMLPELLDRLQEFRGLPHRLEFIARYHNKDFYNDSKATNPIASVLALKSFADQQIIWLAGGQDKLLDLADLCEEAKKHTTGAILFGEAKERFAQNLKEHNYQGEIRMVNSLQGAIEESLCMKGEIVLLSPASSSFDQFRSFEERGDLMREIIKSYQPAT